MLESSLLSIVIPTNGSPQFLRYVLEHYSSIHATRYFKIFVCDASEDESISSLCDDFSTKAFPIHYHRVPADVGFDQQTLIGLRLPDTKFIYLCGHGAILREANIIRLLNVLQTTDYDLYLVMGGWCGQEAHQIPRDDNCKLMEHWFAALTMYGGSVLSKRLIDKYQDSIVRQYWGTYFGYTCNIFEYLDTPFYIFPDTLFEITEVKMKYGSFWGQKNIIEMWAKNYATAIDLLPNKFDNYKSIAKLQHSDEILSRKTIMYYRTTNNYSFRHYKRFKSFLLETTQCSKTQLLMIAITPAWVFKIGYLLKHRSRPWKRHEINVSKNDMKELSL